MEAALWCSCCAGLDETKDQFELVDERAIEMRAKALSAKSNPADFLQITSVFGDLSDQPTFQTTFSSALASVWPDGTASTLMRSMGF